MDQKPLDYLRCVVERITYQSDGYSVLKCAAKGYNDLIAVVGMMPDTHVGSVLTVGGYWKIDAGIRTVCFISPVFPGITDIEAIFERAKDQCDLVWLENLNLRGGVTKTIMDYIAEKHPELKPLYDEIYTRHNRTYFEMLEKKAENMAAQNGCRFVDNETPYERVQQGHPTIVDYFYHEEVKGTANSGIRNK